MNESDWKTFRTMVPALRERYLATKNPQLSAALAAAGKTETERFWNTHKLIEKEAKILRACLDGHSRSTMFQFLHVMRKVGMLTDDDLQAFSPELQAMVRDFD